MRHCPRANRTGPAPPRVRASTIRGGSARRPPPKRSGQSGQSVRRDACATKETRFGLSCRMPGCRKARAAPSEHSDYGSTREFCNNMRAGSAETDERARVKILRILIRYEWYRGISNGRFKDATTVRPLPGSPNSAPRRPFFVPPTFAPPPFSFIFIRPTSAPPPFFRPL